MAAQLNSRAEEALRGAVSIVAKEGPGRWRLSLGNGERLPAVARVDSGWLELTAALPEWALPACNDLRALQVNLGLRGPVRIARQFGDRDPHLRADASLEHTSDLREFVEAACADVIAVVHGLGGVREGLTPPAFELDAPSASFGDLERLCHEAGWRPVAAAPRLRVDLTTRAGVHSAHFDCSPDTASRVVVDLIDMSGGSDICRRAVAALLMAVSSSLLLVKGALAEREGSSSAVLMAPVECASERSVDDALSALAVACRVCGREALALLDERVASEYLALSRGEGNQNTHSSMEVVTCLL